MSGTIEQLKELKDLLDQGVLTQEEFDGQKKAILEKPKITQVSPEPVIVAQPATMQPGMMMQPGMSQPGMMQPGMMHPGMMQPGMMQPGMMQPGMMMANGGMMRPPPPGCPPGGQYVMVKWCGPQTHQGAECMKLAGCIMLPAWGVGLICCFIACCMENDPKDEKEVYKLGDQHYTLNGTLDERVGPGPYGGARGK